MRFDGDAFISYAHLDNVELVEGRKGWVANFHRALEVRVGQLLGKSPHIWRDPKLSGNELFADSLVAKLQHVAVLVSVVSPRYVKSEWALRELTEFCTAAAQQGVIHISHKARVFKVVKTPVELERTPTELRPLIGYDFYRVDPETGKVRELDEVFGPDAHREFWLKLDDLAHDIVALLEEIEDPPPVAAALPAVPASGVRRPGTGPAVVKPAVYLAETTADLRDQRETIRRDLQQQGYAVLPDRALPHGLAETTAAIEDCLKRARMSIHLVGKYYGDVPDGGSQSLGELQHELATARAAAGGFSRLLWVPVALEVVDERQQAVINRLRLDPRIADAADLLETRFEDLRTMMREWLSSGRQPSAAAPPPEAPVAGAAGGPPPRLYLVADRRDGDHIVPWVDGLFDQHLEVLQPIFDGDEAELREYHEENLTTCDGVLIMYGAGNELWVRRKLRELQKASGYGRTKAKPAVGICLVGARTPEKERFRTHEAMVLPQWDGYAFDVLAPFVAQLKARGTD